MMKKVFRNIFSGFFYLITLEFLCDFVIGMIRKFFHLKLSKRFHSLNEECMFKVSNTDKRNKVILIFKKKMKEAMAHKKADLITEYLKEEGFLEKSFDKETKIYSFYERK